MHRDGAGFRPGLHLAGAAVTIALRRGRQQPAIPPGFLKSLGETKDPQAGERDRDIDLDPRGQGRTGLLDYRIMGADRAPIPQNTKAELACSRPRGPVGQQAG